MNESINSIFLNVAHLQGDLNRMWTFGHTFHCQDPWSALLNIQTWAANLFDRLLIATIANSYRDWKTKTKWMKRKPEWMQLHSIITSKRVAKFYSGSFYRIDCFHIEFFSNSCHCLEMQSSLHRLTLRLYVIFHLSATTQLKININIPQKQSIFEVNWLVGIWKSIFHLWKWCHRHHCIGSFLSSQLAISHFCHFDHFGCFRHHYQIATCLSFYLVQYHTQQERNFLLI